MTDKDKFDLANDINFYGACMATYDGAKPLQKNCLQTLGDRVRLITELEKSGFTIVKIDTEKV